MRSVDESEGISGWAIRQPGVSDRCVLSAINPASPEGEICLPVASATGIMAKCLTAQRATHLSSGNDVSPAGLEYHQSQSPVTDATGKDVAPSGLIANFKNRVRSHRPTLFWPEAMMRRRETPNA